MASTAKPPAEAPGRLVRFITCGSVDDGKSTLIGRLLFEAQSLHTDALEALARDSRRFGTTGGDIDFALLVDGLEAEREQGITIDVAYRFFATPRCAFIVADTPGHEQYTRNMATGASTADLAVLLVDARKGLLPQTRRHALICSLFGIRRVILAVNKMDLVGFSEGAFAGIVAAFGSFAADLAFESVEAVPLSARYGDNVVAASPGMPWHPGPTLIEALERAQAARDAAALPFRLPVQWVNRPSADFRGVSGTIAGGRLALGDRVAVAASGRTSRVAGILGPDGALGEAAAGDAVTVTLADAIDVARGDLLAAPKDRPHLGDQFAAHLLWIGEEPLLPGRLYHMRVGTRWVGASVTAIKHRIDVNTGARLAAKTLTLNEIAVCNLASTAPVAFDAHTENRETGSFILVDRATNETAAAGLIDFPLRRAANIHRESLALDKAARAARRGQAPCIVWFTGLSGSGKSTLARLLEQRLHAAGRDTYMLDGDNLRHGLNRDLGFTEADRVENIRRAGEVGKLFVDAGLIVLCAFISPYAADRRMVRDLLAEDEFIEVFVDAPVETCAARDPKGLYAKARAGLLKNFTGIDAPYEAPAAPDLRLDTAREEPDRLVDRIMAELSARGRLG